MTYDNSTFTVTLTPAAALAYSTAYTATVSGAKDLAGNAMSPVSWSFTTAAASDTTAPTVTSKSPASGATGVAVGTAVTATFSEAVQSGTIGFVLKNAAGTAVPATVGVQRDQPRRDADAGRGLAYATTYTATVSGAKDPAGNAMAPVSWSFTTARLRTRRRRR